VLVGLLTGLFRRLWQRFCTFKGYFVCQCHCIRLIPLTSYTDRTVYAAWVKDDLDWWWPYNLLNFWISEEVPRTSYAECASSSTGDIVIVCVCEHGHLSLLYSMDALFYGRNLTQMFCKSKSSVRYPRESVGWLHRCEWAHHWWRFQITVHSFANWCKAIHSERYLTSYRVGQRGPK